MLAALVCFTQLRAGVERVELRMEARDGLVAGADAHPLVQFRYALAGRHAAGVALQAQRHDRLVDLRVVALVHRLQSDFHPRRVALLALTLPLRIRFGLLYRHAVTLTGHDSHPAHHRAGATLVPRPGDDPGPTDPTP